MASGSPAGRSGAKGGFDFASDDILCPYEDYAEQEATNGNHSDPVIGSSSSKDFHKNKMPRSSAYHTTNVYTQPEDYVNQEVVVAVERTIKKYNDNLLRFLEGISSRLSQLELYCYNLDKSIGEMRTELQHDNGEAEAKLKSVDKHLQEVHRSVQILRDKQELADTQKELAKLHLAQKESSHSQDEKVTTPSSAITKTDDSPEMHNLQLALALPNQVPPQPSNPGRAPEQQQPIALSQPMTQQASYYLPATQLPNPSAQHQPQPPQGSYVTSDSQYRAPQVVQNSSHGQVNQSPQPQQFPQYQQQWPQHPVQPAQPQSVQSQTQMRANPTPVYYMQTQPANTPQEALTSPMPMQVPTPGFPHQAVTRAEVMSFGPGGPLQAQPPPQHIKPGSGYSAPGGPYMIYESDGTRTSHSPPMHFTQGGYHHQANTQPQNPHPQPPSGSIVIRGPNPPPQFVRAHPYNELIDKLTSMGYRCDLVASIIQRLEESGQPVDFNAVLDRLNGHSSGGSQRSW
ncbi:hypothetical protein V2J09_002620 [Rumex salicifolius]